MKYASRLLILLCTLLCLTIPGFAEDCHELTAAWFGASGTDGSVLNLETVPVSDEAVLSLLDEYGQERAEEFASSHGRATMGDRAEIIAALEQRINAEITDASVTTFVTDLEETDQGYVATVYEWTFFDYDDLSDGIGGSDTAGFGTEHKIAFVYNDWGELELLQDDYQESDVLTGNLDSQVLQASNYEENISLYAAAPNYDADFDPVKATIYANSWVTKEPLNGGKDPSCYNPDYKNFAASGGDCANYVSQCLTAGGMDQNASWKPYTYSWINCHGMFSQFSNRGKALSTFTQTDIWPGTILFYQYYTHVTICVGHNSAGTPIVNGHTSDRYHVPWNYSDEKIIYIIQLSDFELKDMMSEEDYIVFHETASVPLYPSYRSGNATMSMKGNPGNYMEILASFRYQDSLWFACDVNDTIYYGKLVDGVYLESQVPALTVSAPESVTTNDYMCITVSLENTALADGELILIDPSGETTDVPLTAENGAYSAVVDCQDLLPGTYDIVAFASSDTWYTLVGYTTVAVTEKTTVSSKEGTISWTLDKTTGALVINGSGTITEAGYSRFASKIKTVQTSPAIQGLTAQQFKKGTLKTIYGQPQYLSQLAQELDAEFVEMGFFMDTFPGYWHFDPINYVYEHGLFNGMETHAFWPDWHMDRAMFVTVLARIAGVDTSTYTQCPFTDVLPGSYYFGAVAWASEVGVVKGITETEFWPAEKVTREQAVTLISRFVSLYQLTLPDTDSPSTSYQDMDKVSIYARAEVEAMRLKGVAKGYPDGTFMPQNTLTRAEAAAMFQRLCVAIDGQTPTLPDDQPEDPDAVG